MHEEKEEIIPNGKNQPRLMIRGLPEIGPDEEQRQHKTSNKVIRIDTFNDLMLTIRYQF